jgi:superfamily II DNA/RNA helicase
VGNNRRNNKLKKMDSIQEKALKMALSGHNLLITGYPGTGKSFTVARCLIKLTNIWFYFTICSG